MIKSFIVNAVVSKVRAEEESEGARRMGSLASEILADDMCRESDSHSQEDEAFHFTDKGCLLAKMGK